MLFSDFCESLFKIEFEKRPMPDLPHAVDKKLFEAEKDKKITTGRMFEMIDSILDEDMSIIADMATLCFGASDNGSFRATTSCRQLYTV